MLVRAELSEAAPPIQPGNIPCNNRRCKTCNILIQSDSFTSPCTGSTHEIRFEFKCTTRNLVYLIRCRRCGLKYVGEMGNPLHTRMNGHCSDIRTGKIDKPVAAHFTQWDHSLEDLQFMGIEKISREDITLRKLHESYWISTWVRWPPLEWTSMSRDAATKSTDANKNTQCHGTRRRTPSKRLMPSISII